VFLLKNTTRLVYGLAPQASYCYGGKGFLKLPNKAVPSGPQSRPNEIPPKIGGSPVDLDKLKEFDSCTISNAIERLNVRLRNEGFLSGVSRCRFPKFPPMVGYAATARIRSASPPMSHRCYYDRMDWWNYVASVPEPRVLVLQDADHNPGLGAFVGEIHAAIGVALNCVGCVTNGAVRDLSAVEAMGFQMYANHTSVSHAYAHIVDFGEPVEISSLKISSGDLLHGDRHGVVNIPLSVANQVPNIATKIKAEELALVQFCHSPGFSLQELAERIQNMNLSCDLPWRGR
jgi:4-hydroxy-4-methyl-2-oxoglutarate aldolase